MTVDKSQNTTLSYTPNSSYLCGFPPDGSLRKYEGRVVLFAILAYQPS